MAAWTSLVRVSNTLRALALVLVAVTIGEVFRLPALPVLAIFVFFLFSTDKGTKLANAALAGATLLLGSLGTTVLFMASA